MDRKAKTLLLASIIVGLFLMMRSGSAQCPDPESPRLRGVAALQEFVASRDEKALRAFLEDRLAPDLRKQRSDEEWTDFLRELGSRLGDASFSGASPEGELAVRMDYTRRGRPSASLRFCLDPKSPNLFSAIDSVWDTQTSSSSPDETAVNSTTLEKIDAYIAGEGNENRFSGSVLIAEGASPIFEKAYGLASKRFEIPNRIDTKFNIGSINKIFTMVAIYQLVEKELLKLEDPVGKFLPQFPESVGTSITVDHLLSHRSGWGAYWENQQYLARWSELKTLSDYLTFIKDIPLEFEPGTRFQYSNTGYEVLGGIIESITGQTYYEYMRDHIYKPAGMSDTDAYEMDAPVRNLAIGYTGDGHARNNYFVHPIKGTAAGGGYSTAPDLLKFSLALANNKLVGQEYSERLRRGTFAGGAPGINAMLELDVSGRTVIVLSNYDPPSAQRIARFIRDFINGITPETEILEPADEPTNRIAQALLELTKTKGEEPLRKFITESVFPETRKRNSEALVTQAFDQFRGDLAEAQLKGAWKAGPSSARLEFASSVTGKAVTVALKLEETAPYRIDQFRLELGCCAPSPVKVQEEAKPSAQCAPSPVNVGQKAKPREGDQSNASPAEDRVQSLAASLDPLSTNFNRDLERVRLVALLSPT